MASMRLNIPTVFCSGGPMEAGRWKGENADLITAMIKGADTSVSDEEMTQIEQCACPGCGSCSGMFTANSMNSLTEAIGLSLRQWYHPGYSQEPHSALQGCSTSGG